MTIVKILIFSESRFGTVSLLFGSYPPKFIRNVASICDFGHLRLVPTAANYYLFHVLITCLIMQFDCSQQKLCKQKAPLDKQHS